MAMALSVWARKPHEVVLVVYTFWGLVLLLWPTWYALAWMKFVGPPADRPEDLAEPDVVAEVRRFLRHGPQGQLQGALVVVRLERDVGREALELARDRRRTGRRRAARRSTVTAAGR